MDNTGVNELVATYALNRILFHLSGEGHLTNSGDAAARIIIKRKIRDCHQYDAILWERMKAGIVYTNRENPRGVMGQ